MTPSENLIDFKEKFDAKSIMGIFSLDLNKSIKMVAYTEDPAELVKAIGEYI